MDFSGKVAVVTGGAHRVGKAIALMAARNGANVVVNYHASEVEAVATVGEIEALGVSGLAIQCDVSNLDSVKQMARQIDGEFGGVDILVNSASLFEQTQFPTDDHTRWRRITSISIDGSYYVSNISATSMLRKQEGVIVNIVDLSAWNPWPHFGAHSVGKAGMLALTRQMAVDLAPYVRVNAVAPGPVLPPPGFAASRADAAAERTLLKRWGRPDDVAHAVQYLVEADYVTGEVIVVDGGERWGQRV